MSSGSFEMSLANPSPLFPPWHFGWNLHPHPTHTYILSANQRQPRQQKELCAINRMYRWFGARGILCMRDRLVDLAGWSASCGGWHRMWHRMRGMCGQRWRNGMGRGGGVGEEGRRGGVRTQSERSGGCQRMKGRKDGVRGGIRGRSIGEMRLRIGTWPQSILTIKGKKRVI